ncbi:MAG: sigma-54-dependent Fis family transcriptional regulator [Alphaproteobacteria bacterium]|nr:sigma-54-dependent Fis family transcriptional regulator [Alphaproteobacteria bacterium]
MANERVLVVDDDHSLRQILGMLLERNGYQVVKAGSAEEAVKRLAAQPFELLVTDYQMPGMNGIELIRQVRQEAAGEDAELPIVMLTGVGKAQQAVEAIREGADDFIKKPFNNDEFLMVLRRVLGHRALVEENQLLRSQLKIRYHLGSLIGSSPAMARVYDLVRRVKDSRINCLLQGESGTGKEMVARAIHFSGVRADQPFVAVNCGAIPAELIESELFGYKKGAFTGANRDKIGYFQAADKGTLFLDEVGDMPLLTQVKLLRALSMRLVSPVGGVEEVPVDVRVVAATNKDLKAEVDAGRFREDLYYRLNVVRIDLPPLREREWDVLLLARHFIRQYAEEYSKAVRDLTPEATERLMKYTWPGNVRELRNAIEGAVALEEEHLITVRSLPRSIAGYQPLPRETAQVEPPRVGIIPERGLNLDDVLAEVEQRYLIEALRMCEDNKTRAAKLLGMTFRSFRYRLAKYQLDD